MKQINLIIILSFFILSCEEEEFEYQAVPECINEKIVEIEEGTFGSPATKIFRYRFKGETVYYFDPTCCDFPSMLFDDSCELICTVEGGFSNDREESCPDFLEEREKGELVWEKEM